MCFHMKLVYVVKLDASVFAFLFDNVPFWKLWIPEHFYAEVSNALLL